MMALDNSDYKMIQHESELVRLKLGHIEEKTKELNSILGNILKELSRISGQLSVLVNK